MSHLHFIGGEKGGVGKSLVSRLLAQYFIDHNIPFMGFDSDRSHGALLRFYTEFSSPVAIDDYASLDTIVETAAENPGQRVLVDLAAQTHHPLVSWLQDSGVLELSETLGLSLTYWHVMDTGRDSVDLLRTLLDQFGATLKLVVVLNEVRGTSFDLLAASGELDRARTLGAQLVSIRKLPDELMQKIDGHSSSFWAAVNHTDKAGKGLGLLERQRVKVWLSRAYEEVGKAGL
jgi:hypothetical protein